MARRECTDKLTELTIGVILLSYLTMLYCTFSYSL